MKLYSHLRVQGLGAIQKTRVHIQSMASRLGTSSFASTEGTSARLLSSQMSCWHMQPDECTGHGPTTTDEQTASCSCFESLTKTCNA